jgi:hypothetical protein
MESIKLILDPDQGKSFDAIIHNKDILRLPDFGDLTVVTKDKGTVNGNPIVALAFGVKLPDGRVAIAQTVTTVRLLQFALDGIRAKYGNPT